MSRQASRSRLSRGPAALALLLATALVLLSTAEARANTAPFFTPIGQQSVTAGATFSYQISASDADVPAQHLTYSLDYVTYAGPTITPDGLLTWTTDPGLLNDINNVLIVRVADDGSPSASATWIFGITVVATNHRPVIAQISDQFVYVGNPFTYQVSASDADVPAQHLTYSLDYVTYAGPTITPGGLLSWTPLGPSDINNVMIVTVTDDGSPPASASWLFGIHVLGPNITEPSSSTVFPVGTPVTFAGTFSDLEDRGPHTAEWIFDTIRVPGIVDESAHSIMASHTFTTPGVYTVRLAVTNGLGDVATVSRDYFGEVMIVVYDPNGGFVTGGGWIDSPPGAFLAEPALTGRASFGFISKYHPGRTAPSGETEFQFRAGGLEMHSELYDWLVISGSRAQYKGIGTLHTGQFVDFILSATDGNLLGGSQPDRLRMKISDWWSHEVLYDNQFGAADSSAPSTALGGGSVVIQKPMRAPRASLREEDSPPISVFALSKGTPNPFHSGTEIRMELPVKSEVELSVFDLQGRKVRGLAAGVFPAGRHQQRWNGCGGDGRRLGAGVYLVRLIARPEAGGASHSAVEKLMKIR